MADSKPLEPCPRCGMAGPAAWEKFRKPNGAPAWFCRTCGYVGDQQSITEAAVGEVTPTTLPKVLKKGGKYVSPQ